MRQDFFNPPPVPADRVPTMYLFIGGSRNEQFHSVSPERYTNAPPARLVVRVQEAQKRDVPSGTRMDFISRDEKYVMRNLTVKDANRTLTVLAYVLAGVTEDKARRTIALMHAIPLPPETVKLPPMIEVDDSSFVKAVGFDAKRGLFVELTSGTYQYDAVPAVIGFELLSAESKGRFYNERIKGMYHGTKVR